MSRTTGGGAAQRHIKGENASKMVERERVVVATNAVNATRLLSLAHPKNISHHSKVTCGVLITCLYNQESLVAVCGEL
jgi:hypothetical protein